MLVRLLSIVTIFLTASFIAAISLVRAQTEREMATKTFLDAPDDCAAPCWQGIQPGVTRVEDAIRILDEHPWVGRIDAPADVTNGLVYWFWNEQFPLAHGDRRGVLLARDGIVHTVELHTDLVMGEVWLAMGAPKLGSTIVSPGTVVHYGAYPERGLHVFGYVGCPAHRDSFWHAVVDVKYSLDPTLISRSPLAPWEPPSPC